MKKFKIKKCMTSFLMLVVMVVSIIGVMPNTTAYADNGISDGQYFVKQYYNFTTDDLKGSYDTYSYQPHIGDVKAYCAYNSSSGNYNIFFVSKRSFGIDVKKTDYKGNISGRSVSSDSCSTCMPSLEQGVVYYHAVSFEQYSAEGKLAYHFSSNLGRTLVYTDDLSTDELIMIILGGKTNDSCHWVDSGDTDAGGSTNPIRDKSVGYPDIYEYNFLFSSPGSGGEWDKLKSADYFKWKSKSTTGFKLIDHDSKYKDVYIQAKVVSKMQYNDSFFGKGEWHNFDNYGEEGSFGLLDPSDKEFSVDYQKLTETLPKSFMETHNFKSQYFDFDYYFRIVYTRADDLKVIPTYYSGGWRRISVHSNGKHDENGEGENSSAIITDGDDDGGGWKTDDDSKDNDKNIDNGPSGGTDLDDAKDNANNNKNDSSSSGSLDIDSIKAFMSEVGNVPKAIGKLFSFLPDWVTTFIGFGFVVLVALMIIKAIRG